MPISFLDANVSMQNDLKISFCRDMEGATWTAPVTVAHNVDYASAAAVQVGNLWVVLYSRSGECYARSCANPDDWSSSTETAIAGMSGRVYGMAALATGEIAAVVDSRVWTSRDMGATWTEGGILPISGVKGIVALYDTFLVAAPDSAGPAIHFISTDQGQTWK